MTDTDWKYQVSPKLADGTLVNIRGNDPLDFKKSLEVVADLAGDIAAVTAALSGTQTLANAGITGTAPAPQQAQAVQQYQQSAAQAAPAPQAAAAGPAPVCKHGQMVYKEGNGKRGAWRAYMCAAGQNAPDKCAPTWLD